MNTPATSRRPAPIPLMSWPARLATVLGILGLFAAVCLWVGQASQEAVQSNRAALSGSVICVTLPTVEVVGRREPAAPASSAASTASTGLDAQVRVQRTL